jgi:AcrR family transcriptional regulator
MTAPVRSRRPYDNARRQARASETRDRIVAAGADLLAGSSIRDWGAVTVRAVAERAGVNERTVYRHFAHERALRDAVIHHLERQAGVDLEHLQLEDLAEVTARILRLVSTHPIDPRPTLDPTLAEAGRRQQRVLVDLVRSRTPSWTATEQVIAGAVLDVLWAVGSYERLVADWGLEPRQAVTGLTWAIELVSDAVRDDRRPTTLSRSVRKRQRPSN